MTGSTGQLAGWRSSAAYDRETALLVVDLQNDFAHPSGSLYVRGAEQIVELVNREIESARAAGAIVVYTMDWHPEATPHFQKDGGIWPMHCVRNTWGAELHRDLVIAGEVIRKGIGGEDGYSGFAVRDVARREERRTPLEPLLRAHQIRRLVVVGLATDYCVKETVIDAIRLGFEATVLSSAVRAVDLVPGDGERALESMRSAGARIA